MPDSAAPRQVRSRFRQKAQQFDDLYDDQRLTTRTLRAGLFRRRQLAIDTIRAYGQPRVLDVGCGSGRIGELAIATGASEYLGVDFSETMIELAQARLERFGPRAKLLIADFLTAPIDGPFDVILALGLFDYTPEPHRFSARMSELCAEGGCVVGSFPAWSLVKGPIRKVRYELIGNCPIVNYTRRELELMFGASGFGRVEIASPGRSGFLVRAYREPRMPEPRVPSPRS